MNPKMGYHRHGNSLRLLQASPNRGLLLSGPDCCVGSGVQSRLLAPEPTVRTLSRLDIRWTGTQQHRVNVIKSSV